MMSWTTDVPVKADDLRPGTPEVRALSFTASESGSPAAVSMVMNVRDPATGNWHTATNINPLRLVDEVAVEYGELVEILEEREAGDEEAPRRGSEPRPEPQAKPAAEHATEFIDAILTAKIDGNGALAQKFGIPDGTPLGDALPQMAWSYLYPEIKLKRKGK
jgi:hypothetical protein